MPSVALPRGTLWTDAAAPPRVEIVCAVSERRRLREWADRLAGLGLPWLPAPTVVDSPNGVAFEYPTTLAGYGSASGRLTDWGQDLFTALPLAVGLGRFILDAATGLAEHRLTDAPICPGLVLAPPGSATGWVLLAVPVSAATPADWARADAAAWAWASSPALLTGRVADPVYALGAAIHHGLVGGLLPDLVPDCQKFARVLRGRVGLPARLRTAGRAAAPSAAQTDIEALCQLVLDCLDPRPDRRPSETTGRGRFAELEARLSPSRLARLWDADQRRVTGDKLRRLAASPPKPLPPPPPPAPPPGQDWADSARDHLTRGDATAALAATWNAVTTDGPHKSDLYLAVLQQVAALSPAKAEIASALTRLTQKYPPDQIGEANMIRVAHIQCRYLGAAEADVLPLLHGPKTQWGKGLACVLKVGFVVRRAGASVEVSRLCKEGRQVFERMPDSGGDAGRYARGYLALHDGIAHIGFVAAGNPVDYYTDALDRFGTALQLASEIGHRDLLRSAVLWLSWLSWLAGLSPGKAASTIRTAADALVRMHGSIGQGLGAVTMPDVPAYDEAYLFPV